ncbi:MAG: glycerophosphodiester phosphodiesterase family protein [Flavobacteriaceae bacterium]|nr:glycerophosphodiester phosphodiesterase family protein [Flavobacteriaceae bacterium]
MKRKSISLILLIMIVACDNNQKPLVIGHRGAKGHAPENTIKSIQKAIDLGVDGIEIDVFRCASGELVVFHDKSVEKLTNGIGFIEQMSLDSIKELNVLGTEKIPTLKEILDLIDGKITLNIELKGTNTSFLIHQLLNSYFKSTNWTKDRIFISSFDWNELKAFQQLNKEVRIAVLTEDDPVDAIPIAKELNAFAINPNYNSLNKLNVAKIKSENFLIYTWTVNNIKDINQMKKLGVDAIITDYPDRIY